MHPQSPCISPTPKNSSDQCDSVIPVVFQQLAVNTKVELDAMDLTNGEINDDSKKFIRFGFK
jgi:hypothetical protein